MPCSPAQCSCQHSTNFIAAWQCQQACLLTHLRAKVAARRPGAVSRATAALPIGRLTLKLATDFCTVLPYMLC